MKNGEEIVDNDEAFGALITDLSKTFDCLSQELLIANLDAYSFDNKSLKFVYTYFTKLNDSYSSFGEILVEFLKGSNLGYYSSILLYDIFSTF